MNNSRDYMTPNRLINSNSKNVMSDGKITLRDGVLLKCAQKRINTNVNNGKELKGTQLSVESPKSKSPSATRFRPKTPVINACYTPSSLFRSANASSTPTTSARTVKKTKCFANNDAEDLMRVAVRVRPLNAKECTFTSVSNIIRVVKNEVTVLVGSSADSSSGVSHSFAYDHVFFSCDPESLDYANQKDVFLKTAQPLIVRAFEGYNACLFAYGQTGSGKSYSMMGIDTFDGLEITRKGLSSVELSPDAGIIPRFCNELFRYIEEGKDKFFAEVEVSYFEIYNEKIHDLLCVSNDMENNGKPLGGTPIKLNRKALKVREHPIWGPYVVDLSVHPVDSFEALRNWLIVGNSQRATVATGLNDKSSRSHSIFNIMLKINHLELSNTDYKETPRLHQSRSSKISLVDLAGSERISGSNGERIREGVHINKSLLTLGKVISALSDDRNGNNNAVFVPYRESVLTWLLRVCNVKKKFCSFTYILCMHNTT